MSIHLSHTPSLKPRWQRWLGLSEVWVHGDLSAEVLVTLRWLAVLGQSFTIYLAWRLGVKIEWWPCTVIVGSTLLTNAALSWWVIQLRGSLGGGFFHIALLDVIGMTMLLYWTGGLLNPFALFFLVQLTLAAVALRAPAVITLGLLSAAACGWLHDQHARLVMQDGSAIPAELMAKGHATAILLAGGFMLALLLALRRRSHRLQKERERLRAELDSRERFLSVAALATGFAHELGTPLGTIAMAADEMLAHPDADSAAIIAREAERCQRVLQRLRELGQEATGKSSEPCLVKQVLEASMNELPPTQRERVRLTSSASDAQVTCAGLREALLVLLRNALLASQDEGLVNLRVDEAAGMLRFVVEDRGPGFDAEMLRHWGEPFRTTRDPGSGLGLGLFFVRRLAAAMHGSVQVENRGDGGARVTLQLPRHHAPTDTHA